MQTTDLARLVLSIALALPLAAASPGRLNHPSLAIELRNGNIFLNGDANHRLIVLSRRTKQILWQYGFTGAPGRRPGHLRDLDGVDLKPTTFGR